MEIQNISCFLLDMDGTIYLGDQLIPGADRFLAVLKERGIEFFFLTNNSSKDKQAYVEKLARFGLQIAPQQVITSGEATAIYLNTQKPRAKVFLLGTQELAREFREHGFVLVGKEENPDVVVLGFDTTLTYQKLWDACDLIREGVEYIATHPDYNCPLPGGRYMPDTGAMIAAIEASTGRVPKVIGKPNQEIVDAVLTRTNCPRTQVAIVGDRLYTDIAMGNLARMPSILVLSGEAKRADLKQSPHKPTYVYKSVLELGQEIARTQK